MVPAAPAWAVFDRAASFAMTASRISFTASVASSLAPMASAAMASASIAAVAMAAALIAPAAKLAAAIAPVARAVTEATVPTAELAALYPVPSKNSSSLSAAVASPLICVTLTRMLPASSGYMTMGVVLAPEVVVLMMIAMVSPFISAAVRSR